MQVLKIVARHSAVDLEFREGAVGGIALDTRGTPLPDEVLEHARESDAILLGAVGGPKWDNPNAEQRPEQALLGLRKELGLFANLRPVKTIKELSASSPLKPEIINGVDLIVLRELTGGIYYGKPSERRKTANGREAVDTCFYTEPEIGACAALRLRAGARSAQASDLGRQGQHPGDLAALARDRGRDSARNSRMCRSRTSWSTRWRCI